MGSDVYSVEQVAERLGLHVRTVRNYIRDGRLKAVKIGKQYRIARADLAALTGTPALAAAGARHVEVSSIVQIDGIAAAAADRLGILLTAGAAAPRDSPDQLRIQTIHDAERSRLKIVILGGPAVTADILALLDDLLGPENGLFGTAEEDPAETAGGSTGPQVGAAAGNRSLRMTGDSTGTTGHAAATAPGSTGPAGDSDGGAGNRRADPR